VDVPRLFEGGIGAQFFGLVSIPVGRSVGCGAIIDAQIDRLDLAVRDPARTLVKSWSADDVIHANARGAIAAFLGIEGAHALEGDLSRIEHFARRGVRYLGLSHFSANRAAYPGYGTGRRDTEGLTPFGREVVRTCEALGVLVDLAHVNRKGFLEACAMATVPPIVSHTGSRAAYRHWRNIDDEQIRAIADHGGIIGVLFCPRYLGRGGLRAVVKHLRNVMDVGGEEVAALGSDWDGFIVPTADLRDAAHLPNLTDALLGEGLSEATIARILRGNVLRVLGGGKG
jgi:membrane dipeptidase